MRSMNCIQCLLDGADTKVEIVREDGEIGVCYCHFSCKNALMVRIGRVHAESHGTVPFVDDGTGKGTLS